MSNSNKTAKSLNPLQNLEGKNNYQKFILVEKNGNTKTRIILFIPNIDLREQVICNHFISRYVQLFIEQTTGVKLLSRDNPWDFELELSNSENLIIEITSIADEIDLFRTFKYQERITDKSNYAHIEFHELIKLNNLFPDPAIEQLIISYRKQKINKNALVINPHYGKDFIFQSSTNEDLKSLDKLIKEAVDKKLKKNHSGKEDVTLIIDNRTVTYELEDILNYLGNTQDYLLNLPFKEVWLYTGYYSDLDGSNAEYSFAPLKIDKEKLERLKTRLEE